MFSQSVPVMRSKSSTAVPIEGSIALAHGEGGRLTRRLIQDRIAPHFNNLFLSPLGDSAVLPALNGPVVFSTDSFVVSPLFFPGGDIGKLAVNGTVNDLLMSGARPRWLSLSFIIEEGLSLEILDRVLKSVVAAAEIAEVQVVTGDTKVVPKGCCDQLFLNTSGVGEWIPPAPPGPQSLQPGDALIVSGPIGRHGIAVLASRESMAVDPAPTSDCAPLTGAVEALRRRQIPVRALRDATRGGVAAVLHEWAHAGNCSLVLDESQINVTSEVRGVCELLGLDPLHVANEGTMVAAVAEEFADRAVAALRTAAVSAAAARVGEVIPKTATSVFVRTLFGRNRPLDEPLGAPLPRIC